MAQIVPDVTVVSEIVNIAVAFRSSVWPYKLNLSPCQWIFIKMDELVLWWVRMGLYTVVMEGSENEFKVEEKWPQGL